jgi:hypothetical protein
VNRVERLEMEEMFVQLAADAIQRRHPQADWLVTRANIGRIRMSDAALEAACERLGIWLVEHAPEVVNATGA